jgi:adenosyl cobinamide kinase/adenosyl cobinamide phosphate guanylyltransferase
MLNIEILMEELEDETKMHPPSERKMYVERILDDYDPNAMIILAKAPEDIQERIKELDDNREEIWEWIHEEANLHNVTI